MSMVNKFSLTAPNEEWLHNQVEAGHYADISEAVNSLIGKTRETDLICQRLIASEQSAEEHGLVERTPIELLEQFKANARRDGFL